MSTETYSERRARENREDLAGLADRLTEQVCSALASQGMSETDLRQVELTVASQLQEGTRGQLLTCTISRSPGQETKTAERNRERTAVSTRYRFDIQRGSEIVASDMEVMIAEPITLAQARENVLLHAQGAVNVRLVADPLTGCDPECA